MAALSSLRQSVRGLRGMREAVQGLTDAEAAKLTKGTAERFLELRRQLPSANEMAAVAQAGGSKKGWYRNSTQALQQVFGEDAPRFTALLAATSPQTSVESNLLNALNIWKNWTAEGRPTGRDDIIRIMGDSVGGDRGVDSVLDAWINNSVESLSNPNADDIILSGPKVDSFMRNLSGVMNEVTNDTWMARYGGQPQTIFSGARTATDPGKGAGYMAMNSKVRDTARRLEEITGEPWDPAEVQETVWSWAYGLRNRNKGQRIMDNLRELSDADVAVAPEFGALMQQPRYRGPLSQAGYDAELERLGEPQGILLPEEDIAQGALVTNPREIRQAARRIARGFGERAAAPLAAGAGAAALATPEEAEAGALSTGRQMQDAAERMVLQRQRTPEERDAWQAEQDAMRARGEFDQISQMSPTEMSAYMDQLIADLNAPEQVFLGEDEIVRATGRRPPMSNRSMAAAGAGGAGALTLGDELVGAGQAAGSLANAVLTGIGAEGQVLLGALSPFLSSEEALAYAERARARPPAVSMDPRAQPYMDFALDRVDDVASGFGQLGADIGRGFGRQSPLYQGIPGYRMAYDEAARVGGVLGDLYDEYAPERLKLGLGALYNIYGL